MIDIKPLVARMFPKPWVTPDPFAICVRYIPSGCTGQEGTGPTAQFCQKKDCFKQQ